MRVVEVDKFVEKVQEACNDCIRHFRDDTSEESFKKALAFFTGVDYVLDWLMHSNEYTFEVAEIAKDITYPRGCDETNIDCEECEHHRGVEWCARAIKDHGDVDPAYETGWMDGVEAAAKNLDGYTIGYADGWDDGWTESLESIKIAINKIFEDNK